jgi:hypothetical protein
VDKKRKEKRELKKANQQKIAESYLPAHGSYWSRFWSWKHWNRVAIIITIVSAPVLIYSAWQWLKPASVKLKELNEVHGTLNPKPIEHQEDTNLVIRNYPFKITRPPISESPPAMLGILLPSDLVSNPNLKIYLGSNSIDHAFLGDYFSGVDLNYAPFGCAISDVKMSLKILANRLFISTSFRDIQTNDLVGTVVYNDWTLYVPNMLRFAQSDSTLEVYDKHGYAITRIKFKQPNGILIQGYYAGADSAWVLARPQNCYNIKSQHSEMIKEIETIDTLKW